MSFLDYVMKHVLETTKKKTCANTVSPSDLQARLLAFAHDSTRRPCRPVAAKIPKQPDGRRTRDWVKKRPSSMQCGAQKQPFYL